MVGVWTFRMEGGGAKKPKINLRIHSTPPKRGRARPISPLLHQWFVEFPSRTRMNLRPALFAIVLQTSDIGTEERSKFASTTYPLALVTHLIIQNIRLHFHLRREREGGG